jgi:hypothetical protein
MRLRIGNFPFFFDDLLVEKPIPETSSTFIHVFWSGPLK